MRLIVALSIAFVLGTTSSAAADDVYRPKIVRSCTVYSVPGVGKICGFSNLEDWKLVLEADAELVFLREQAKNEKARADNLALQVVNLQSQVAEYERTQNLLLERTEKLSRDLIALDKKYQNERVKKSWGSPLAWTIAAVSTSVLVGVVAANALD